MGHFPIRICYFVCFCACLTGPLRGQPLVPTQAERLLEQAYDFAYVHIDSCQHYALLALEHAQPTGDDALLADIYVCIGENFAELKQVDSVLHYFQRAQDIYLAHPGPEAQARSLKIATAIARTRGRNKESLKLSLQWAKACRELGDEQGLADAYWATGTAFYHQDQRQQALDYSKRALKLMARGDDRVGYASGLIGYSECQYLQSDYAGALQSLEEARAIISGETAPLLMVDLCLNQGKIYIAQDSLVPAARSLRSGIVFADLSGAQIAKAMLYGTLGRVALREGNYQEAIQLLKRELTAAVHFPEHYYSTDYQLSLSKAFAAQGNYDSAYHYLSVAERSYRQFVHDDYDQQLSELQISYEISEKESRIARQEVELNRRRTQLYASGAVTFFLLLVILTCGIFSRQLGQKIRQNERLIREKETLIGEIHHRVKNNLQVIASLLQLQGRRLATRNPQLVGILRDTQSRVEAMGLIHQKLYLDENLVTVNMSVYLEELGEVLLDAYRMDDCVELFLDVEPLLLDVNVAIPVGLIVNELITNSLKHAFPNNSEGTVEIALYQEKGQVVLRVSDNGSGPAKVITVQRSAPSFGTELISLLTKKLRGVARQIDTRGYATEIVFTLKVPNPSQ